jgi:hypothetical protein
MKTSSKLWMVAGLAAALVTVAGCSSSSDDGNVSAQGSAGPATVPDSAGTTVAGFIAYLIGLDANDEKSEPLLIKDSFAVPADEGSDPQPIV